MVFEFFLCCNRCCRSSTRVCQGDRRPWWLETWQSHQPWHSSESTGWLYRWAYTPPELSTWCFNSQLYPILVAYMPKMIMLVGFPGSWNRKVSALHTMDAEELILHIPSSKITISIHQKFIHQKLQSFEWHTKIWECQRDCEPLTKILCLPKNNLTSVEWEGWSEWTEWIVNQN